MYLLKLLFISFCVLCKAQRENPIPPIYVDLGDRWAVIQPVNYEQDQVSWQMAQDFCEHLHGGEMLTIKNGVENMAIASAVHIHTKPLLIGLYGINKDEQQWKDGWDGEFEYWAPNKQTPGQGQWCTYMDMENKRGTWNIPYSCKAHEHGFICQIPKEDYTPPPPPPPEYTCPEGFSLYDGACYAYMKTPLPFDAARANCGNISGESGSLLSVQGLQEQAEVMRLIFLSGATLDEPQFQYTLIGFKKGEHGEHVWDDGSYNTMTNWNNGNPQEGLDCTWLDLHTTQWISGDCATPKPYICKIYRDDQLLPIPDREGSCPDIEYSRWVPQGDYCYYFSSEKVSWDTARAKCLEKNAILTPIHHPATNDHLWQETRRLTRNSQMWIGFHKGKSGNWGWEDNKDTIYTNWDVGHPDPANSVALLQGSSTAKVWITRPAHEEKNYICRADLGDVTTEAPHVEGDCPAEDWIPYGPSCYLFQPDFALFLEEAKKECRLRGGSNAHLVSINSLAENHFIQGKMYEATPIPLHRNHWIGLHCTEEIVGASKRLNCEWDSQASSLESTPVSFTNWLENEPHINQCTMISTEDGFWRSQNCEKLRGFVCEYKKGTGFADDEDGWNVDISKDQTAAIAISCGVVGGIVFFIVGVYLYQHKRSKRQNTNDDELNIVNNMNYSSHTDDIDIAPTSEDTSA